MKIFRNGSRNAAGILAIGTAIVVSGGARAECEAFPKVEWWENLSHDTVREFVDEEFDGSWAPYLEKWDVRRIKLKRLADNDMSLTIDKTGTVLKGASLKAHIKNVEKRLQVARCLAATEDSSGFDTTEGTAPIKPASK
jgi:hypothetical protein